MDENEFKKNEPLETTKEVLELDDLNPVVDEEENVNGIEMENLDDFDENRKESEIVFKTELETKEELKKEKKENIFKKLKRKWNSLSKKNKILFVCLGVFLLLLIIFLIVFLVMLIPKEEEAPKEPDVILEMDNYRYENGSLVFLDGEKELGRYECENKDENLCATALLTTDDAMDTKKRVDEDGNLLHFHSLIYFDRFVFIRDSKNAQNVETLIYDLETNEVVKTVFEVLQDPEYENYFVTKDKEGNRELIEFTESEMKTLISSASLYQEIHMIPDTDALSLVSVKKNQEYFLVNITNTNPTRAITNRIVGANNQYMKAKEENGRYHVYDYNGKEINPNDSYDYVALLPNVLIGVVQNNIVIKDYNNHDMSMDHPALTNKNYNPVETIQNNKVIKTEKSFDYELTDSMLNLNVYDGIDKTNYTFDLREGALSTHLAYMNYFNGTLYFYTDQEKTNPVGSYRCTNRNEVGNDTTTLSACKPATETVYRETRNLKENGEHKVGVLPLILKQYMFIQDGDTIVLQNVLNDGKELATYESVDASIYSGLGELSISTVNNVSFIAKSKNSGNFGVANISSEGVRPVISFNKESILKLGDYYVVKENGKYSLYDSMGEKVTEDKASPIVDYYKNYLKTFNDGNYHVHSFDSTITETGYDYVELYDDYYAAVLNGKVHVYSYKDPSSDYITDGEESGAKLELSSEYYYGKNVNAFKIRFDSSYLYLSIGQTNGTYTTERKYPLKKTTTQQPDPPSEEEESND